MKKIITICLSLTLLLIIGVSIASYAEKKEYVYTEPKTIEDANREMLKVSDATNLSQDEKTKLGLKLKEKIVEMGKRQPSMASIQSDDSFLKLMSSCEESAGWGKDSSDKLTAERSKKLLELYKKLKNDFKNNKISETEAIKQLREINEKNPS